MVSRRYKIRLNKLAKQWVSRSPLNQYGFLGKESIEVNMVKPVGLWVSRNISFMMTSSDESFPRYWPFVREIHRSSVDFPHKGPVTRGLMVLWFAPEQTVEKTIGTTVIWDAIALIMTSL